MITQIKVVIIFNVLLCSIVLAPKKQQHNIIQMFQGEVCRFHICKKTRILSIASTFECTYIGHYVALNQVTWLDSKVWGGGWAAIVILLAGAAFGVLQLFRALTHPPSLSLFSGPLTFNSSTPSKPTDDVTSNGSAPSSKEYNRQLTALNCSVRDWITKHVNDNPLCDLNPIFRDYERHLASIERKYGSGTSDGGVEKRLPLSVAATSVSSSAVSASVSGAASQPFSFKDKDDAAADKPAAAAPPGISFNFGQKVDSSVLGGLVSSGAPSFSFSSSSSSSSSGVSLFGSAVSSVSPAVSSSLNAASNSQTAGMWAVQSVFTYSLIRQTW